MKTNQNRRFLDFSGLLICGAILTTACAKLGANLESLTPSSASSACSSSSTSSNLFYSSQSSCQAIWGTSSTDCSLAAVNGVVCYQHVLNSPTSSTGSGTSGSTSTGTTASSAPVSIASSPASATSVLTGGSLAVSFTNNSPFQLTGCGFSLFPSTTNFSISSVASNFIFAPGSVQALLLNANASVNSAGQSVQVKLTCGNPSHTQYSSSFTQVNASTTGTTTNNTGGAGSSTGSSLGSTVTTTGGVATGGAVTSTVSTGSSTSTTLLTTGGSITTGGGCFIAGTKIEMEDGSLRSIEQIKVGDRVRSATGGVNTVMKLHVIPHQGLKYAFNDHHYFVSSSHPFLTEFGWKSMNPGLTLRESPGLLVSQLSEGDVVLTLAGSVRIHTIRAERNASTVYNFTTDGNHTYVADGYKVHNLPNKTTSGGAGGGGGSTASSIGSAI